MIYLFSPEYYIFPTSVENPIFPSKLPFHTVIPSFHTDSIQNNIAGKDQKSVVAVSDFRNKRDKEVFVYITGRTSKIGIWQ